jgi:hypothetical protein
MRRIGRKTGVLFLKTSMPFFIVITLELAMHFCKSFKQITIKSEPKKKECGLHYLSIR